MVAENPDEKQARFDKALAEKLDRNRQAAEEAAAKTRHHSQPKHGDQGKQTGRRHRKTE